MKTQGMETFATLAERARQASIRKEHERRAADIARLIDELSGEMGSASFVDALRVHGYNVEADLGMLSRRGVDRFKH